METLRRTWAQFQKLYQGLAPSQRLTITTVPLLVIVALVALMYYTPSNAEEALLAGKVFSTEELRGATEALQKAGLNQFKVDGQKIMVPKADATRYSAALLANGGMPAAYGAELEKMHEKVNWFTTDKERQELRELAKQKELAKLIEAIPEIDKAAVIWERSKHRPFGGAGKVTATVSVRPKAGRQISSALVGSLRHAVSGAVADLAAGDVTVLNTGTGMAYRPEDPNDPTGSQFIDNVRQFTTLHEQNIGNLLHYIPNVIVSVNVDLDNLKGAVERETIFDAKQFSLRTTEQKETLKSDERTSSSEPGAVSNAPRHIKTQAGPQNVRNLEKSANTTENIPVTQKTTEKALMGLLPKSVQVAVSIPRDYYRDVVRKQGESESDKQAFQAKVQIVEAETLKQVKETVGRLYPGAGGAAASEHISVTSYVRLESEQAAGPVSTLNQASELLAQWGGPAGLALFAMWVLWTLNRSLKRMPQEPAAPRSESTKSTGGGNGGSGTSGAAESVGEEEPEIPLEITKRDKLQGLVRDNPEMAAAVISKWISPAK